MYMFTNFLEHLRSYMVVPDASCGECASSILVVLSAQQFCISHSKGDEKIKADSSGRCTVSWNKYEDMGKACLGEIVSSIKIFQNKKYSNTNWNVRYHAKQLIGRFS